MDVGREGFFNYLMGIAGSTGRTTQSVGTAHRNVYSPTVNTAHPRKSKTTTPNVTIKRVLIQTLEAKNDG